MAYTRKLLPGQPGTKKLLEKFGEDLFCVRYRYDAKKKRKIKTVELIIEQDYWEGNQKEIAPDEIVYIRVGFGETDLRKKVKAAGGRWDGDKKLWQLSNNSNFRD